MATVYVFVAHMISGDALSHKQTNRKHKAILGTACCALRVQPAGKMGRDHILLDK